MHISQEKKNPTFFNEVLQIIRHENENKNVQAISEICGIEMNINKKDKGINSTNDLISHYYKWHFSTE